MERIATSHARDGFAQLVNRVAFGGERIIIQRRGEELVALISIDDLVHLLTVEDEEATDIADAKHALAESERIPWTEAKAKLGL
jgi:antitoxin Phd